MKMITLALAPILASFFHKGYVQIGFPVTSLICSSPTNSGRVCSCDCQFDIPPGDGLSCSDVMGMVEVSPES